MRRAVAAQRSKRVVTTADMLPIAQASAMRQCGLSYGTSETLITHGCSQFLRRNYTRHAQFSYNTVKAQALRETRAHGRYWGALEGAFGFIDWLSGGSKDQGMRSGWVTGFALDSPMIRDGVSVANARA